MITWNLQIQMATRNDLIKKLILKSGQRYAQYKFLKSFLHCRMAKKYCFVVKVLENDVNEFFPSSCFCRALTSKLEIVCFSISIQMAATMNGDTNSL